MVNGKIKTATAGVGYFIGVDGGGTKTLAALSDPCGKIIRTAKGGSSNPRNVGIPVAAANIAEAIFKAIKNKRNIAKE